MADLLALTGNIPCRTSPDLWTYAAEIDLAAFSVFLQRDAMQARPVPSCICSVRLFTRPSRS